jgi:Zn-dependent metalloprotease
LSLSHSITTIFISVLSILCAPLTQAFQDNTKSEVTHGKAGVSVPYVKQFSKSQKSLEQAPNVQPGKAAKAALSAPGLGQQKWKVEWHKATGKVRKMSGGLAPTTKAEPALAARSFLAENNALLGLSSDASDVRVKTVHNSLMGTHVRMQQYVGDIPVYNSEVTVHIDESGGIYQLNSENLIDLNIDTTAKVLANDALKVARQYLKDAVGVKSPDAPQLVVYPMQPGNRLAYKVTINTSKPLGSWRCIVDAQTGEMLGCRNMLCFASGAGRIFNPSPPVAMKTNQLIDMDDSNDAIPDLAYSRVTLGRLDGSGFLSGDWVSTKLTPNAAYEPNLEFLYSREDNRFEEVMIYYHVDTAHEYMASLGFTDIMNYQIPAYNGYNPVNGMVFDERNAMYYGGDVRIMVFGTGGTDTAEDAEVILHEYGHATQDNQVPGWGKQHEGRAMGEGFGDYMATSFLSRVSDGYGDACMGEWFGVGSATSPSGGDNCLRRVDSNKIYPTDMIDPSIQGSIYPNSAIWSGALWACRSALQTTEGDDRIGSSIMDTIIIQSHYLLTPNALFRDGAEALVKADYALYDGAHVPIIVPILVARGLLPASIVPNLNGIPVISGLITESVTLTEPIYIVLGATVVLDPATPVTMTIAAGTVLKFGTTEYKDGESEFDEYFLDVFGTLKVEGTPAQPVIFTSIKDEVFGATVRPTTVDVGESMYPTPGDFKWVRVQDQTKSSVIENAIFLYGGGTDDPFAGGVAPWKKVNLFVEGYPVTVRSCTFGLAHGSGAGYHGAELMDFIDCNFTTNTYAGISNINYSPIRLTNCTVIGNVFPLLGLWPSYEMTNSRFLGNHSDIIVLTVNDITLTARPEPYKMASPPTQLGFETVVDGNLTIEQGATLLLQPDLDVSYTKNHGLYINGVIRTSLSGGSDADDAEFDPGVDFEEFGLAVMKAADPLLINEHPVPNESGFFPPSETQMKAISKSAPTEKDLLSMLDTEHAKPGAGGSTDTNLDKSWGGIYLSRTIDDGRSFLVNLTIDSALIGVNYDRNSTRMSNTTITNSRVDGVRISIASHPEIRSTTIYASAQNGIVCEQDSSPALRNNFIMNSGNAGLRIQDISNPLLVENVLWRNRIGVEITGTAAPVLGDINNIPDYDDGRNIIADNSYYNLINDTGNTIRAQNIFWGTNNLAAIDLSIYDDDENPASGRVIFLPLLGVNPLPVMTPTPDYYPTPTPHIVPPTPTPIPAIEQILSGTVDSDRNLSGFVLVTGDVTVRGFASLTFQPGTVVRISNQNIDNPTETIEITCTDGGRLQVLGERDKPVVFAAGNNEYWGGLVVKSPSILPSVVRYAHIIRACTGLHVTNNDLEVNNNRFQYCKVGLEVSNLYPSNPAPLVRKNLFMENKIGIKLNDGANPDLGPDQEHLGLNVFFLNKTADVDITNSLLPFKGAVGNYWSEEGPDGSVLRMESIDDIKNRRILGSTDTINIDPIGPIAGTSGRIVMSDVVWLGTIELAGEPNAFTRPEIVNLGVQGSIIENVLHVDISSRLTILPGTIVRVEPHTNTVLRIEGRLDAIGTPARPIIFKSAALNPGDADWSGIRMINGGALSENSVLRYCIIKDANTCFTTLNRSPLLEHNIFSNFASQAILVSSLGPHDYKGALDSEANKAKAGNGFGVPQPMINYCDIRGGDHGIVSLNGAPIISNSNITSSIISSIYVQGANVPNLGDLTDTRHDNDGNNIIGGSIRWDLENISQVAIKAQNNFWGAISRDELVDSRIFDDEERIFSGQVTFVPRRNTPPAQLLTKGNADGVGEIDIADITAFSKAWHSVIGDKKYNKSLDFDRDYQIDTKDLLFISNQLTR